MTKTKIYCDQNFELCAVLVILDNILESVQEQKYFSVISNGRRHHSQKQCSFLIKNFKGIILRIC